MLPIVRKGIIGSISANFMRMNIFEHLSVNLNYFYLRNQFYCSEYMTANYKSDAYVGKNLMVQNIPVATIRLLGKDAGSIMRYSYYDMKSVV